MSKVAARDTDVDADGEVRISFCLYARWLNKFAFTAVSDLTSECRERLGDRITDFATSIGAGAGPTCPEPPVQGP